MVGRAPGIPDALRREGFALVFADELFQAAAGGSPVFLASLSCGLGWSRLRVGRDWHGTVGTQADSQGSGGEAGASADAVLELAERLGSYLNE
jgi:hypothetical protein